MSDFFTSPFLSVNFEIIIAVPSYHINGIENLDLIVWTNFSEDIQIDLLLIICKQISLFLKILRVLVDGSSNPIHIAVFHMRTVDL